MSGRWLQSIRRLSPNCREAARLISDAADRELPRLDQIGLKLHLLICRACRSYRRSVEFLRDSLRIAGQSDAPISGQGLSPEARQRLRSKLLES